MLKRKFSSHPILVNPDPTKPLRVESDTSNFATGAVLSMKCDDDKWRSCAYLSKGLNEVECNYDVYNKEMLGVIRALEAWRHHLEGATHKVDIWTDHRNLEYFMNNKKLSHWQAQWALFLSRFDFTIIHKAGTSMRKTDVLLWRPDFEQGVENDNKDVTLLKPEFFHVWALWQGHLLLEGEESELLSKIQKSKEYNEAIVKVVKELKRSPVKVLRTDEWSEEQGLILFRGKIYVPKDKQLRRRLVMLHHDSPIAGYPGQWKTLELVSRNYWWPGISKFVFSYVDGCDKCQQAKIYPQAPAGKLRPNPIATTLWKNILVDFVTGLPSNDGCDTILTVCCRKTKQVHAIPTTTETSSAGLAKLYWDHIWKLHGMSDTIISDRGPQFASGFMKELSCLLGIKLKLLTAYHSQTDGQTECMNQKLEQYLRLFVNHQQLDWV
jgi:hypothetical protein